MAYHVVVKPSGFTFEVQEHETILAAALRCGYFFAHRCRAAICGTCMGELLQGEIDYAGRRLLAISPEEQAQGKVLFCSAQARSDLVIYVENFGLLQMTSAKEWIYSVVHAELIAHDVTRIILKPHDIETMHYRAGQYIKVVHPDGSVSPLSIAAASRQDHLLELHLSHPENNQQARELLRIATEENNLILRGPYGSNTIGKLYSEKPILFLARGTGFAPIKALIEEFIKSKTYPAMHLYWSVTTPEELYLDELISQWVKELKNFSYTPVLSQPFEQWQGKVGLLQQVVLSDYANLENHYVYISAPEPIVHDVLHELQNAKLPQQQYCSDIYDYDVNE